MKTYDHYRWHPRRLPREFGYWGRRRRDATVGPLTRDNTPNFAAIVHHDNLLRIHDEVCSMGGQSPGPDRVTYDDLSRPELADILRDVSREIRAGRYRPSVARIVQIPKATGGYRTLRIRSIVDRIVAAALVDALTPYWESVFVDRSYGYRPNRSVWQMLAAMEREMIEQDRWVLVADDIHQAFDHVVIDQVMQTHRRHFDDVELLNLIECVLRGNPPRTIGIDQGSAYSPLALNVLLHDRLDSTSGSTSISTSSNALTSTLISTSNSTSRDCAAPPPQYRYADNILYLCRSVPEGRQALCQLASTLQEIGLSPKGGNDNQPIDLHRPGSHVEILGFTLRRDGNRIQYGFDNHAWENLARGLTEARNQANPSRTVISTITGWINGYGPVFESLPDDAYVRRILKMADRAGFREISPDRLREAISRSQGNWRSLRDCWMSREEDQTGFAAAPQAADNTGHAQPQSEAAIGTSPSPADRGSPF